MVKIILDTNILISLLIGKEFRKYQYHIFENDNIQLLVSQELLNEFFDVVKRPKLQKYFNPILVEEFIIQLLNKVTFIDVQTNINLCRDYKDNFLLSLAIDGYADYIISSDMDLLILEKCNNTKIITLPDFIANYSF